MVFHRESVLRPNRGIRKKRKKSSRKTGLSSRDAVPSIPHFHVPGSPFTVCLVEHSVKDIDLTCPWNVFTDGSFYSGKNRAGYGVFFQSRSFGLAKPVGFGSKFTYRVKSAVKEIDLSCHKLSSMTMELLAILDALVHVQRLWTHSRLFLYTDCLEGLKLLRRFVSNAVDSRHVLGEFLKAIVSVAGATNVQIFLFKVKGHAEIFGNEMADKLAHVGAGGKSLAQVIQTPAAEPEWKATIVKQTVAEELASSNMEALEASIIEKLVEKQKTEAPPVLGSQVLEDTMEPGRETTSKNVSKLSAITAKVVEQQDISKQAALETGMLGKNIAQLKEIVGLSMRRLATFKSLASGVAENDPVDKQARRRSISEQTLAEDGVKRLRSSTEFRMPSEAASAVMQLREPRRESEMDEKLLNKRQTISGTTGTTERAGETSTPTTSLFEPKFAPLSSINLVPATETPRKTSQELESDEDESTVAGSSELTQGSGDVRETPSDHVSLTPTMTSNAEALRISKTAESSYSLSTEEIESLSQAFLDDELDEQDLKRIISDFRSETAAEKTVSWNEFEKMSDDVYEALGEDDSDIEWIQRNWKEGAEALGLEYTPGQGEDEEFVTEELLEIMKTQWPEGAHALQL